MVIQTSNPIKNYFSYKKEIDLAIKKVLNNGRYILGKNVSLFEKEFAKFCNSKYCVSVASGTDAIILSLLSQGIGYKDEVITTNFTANATITAICSIGAIPVTIDIDEEYFHVNENLVEKSITKNTKAIIGVHLYGQACEINKLLYISKKYKLILIEDCSQAHGATFYKKITGNFGKLGTFSFYPTKNIGALGDAGAIITNNKKDYNKLLLLREYGWKKRYYSKTFGTNSRLDEIQAAILRIKLKYYKNDLAKRILIAQKYYNKIHNDLLELPKIRNYSTHVFHLFVIKVKFNLRDKLIKYMNRKKINLLVQYPFAINQQKYFTKYLKNKRYPVSNRISKQVLSLPIYPELKNNEQMSIIKLLNEFKN